MTPDEINGSPGPGGGFIKFDLLQGSKLEPFDELDDLLMKRGEKGLIARIGGPSDGFHRALGTDADFQLNGWKQLSSPPSRRILFDCGLS